MFGDLQPSLYLIKLSKRKKPDDFVKFMFEEVFSVKAIAKEKQFTRSGRIERLTLLAGSNSPSGVEGGSDGNQNEFLLVVEGLVSGIDFERINKIKEFGASIKMMGNFSNAFSWTRQDKQK